MGRPPSAPQPNHSTQDPTDAREAPVQGVNGESHGEVTASLCPFRAIDIG